MVIFYIIYLTWFLTEIFLNRILRSGRGDKKDQDKGTIRLIWMTIGIANTLGILSAVWISYPISRFLAFSYIGLAIILAGMAFRLYAIISLGRFFTVDVTLREGHLIKKDGIYAVVRHPFYTGMIMSFIGFGMSFNNWISLLVIIVPVTSAILYRIKIEERALTGQFGEEYAGYMKTTWRLIPWIF